MHTLSGYPVCTFCGGSHITWNTEHSFLCTDCHKTNFVNMSTAAGVFFYNEAGEVLIAERGREPDKGKYDDPGGFVDLSDHSAEDAVVREVSEELGIIIQKSDLHYLGSESMNYIYQDRDMPVLVMYFTAYLSAEQIDAIITSDDVATVKWVTRSTFDSSDMVNQGKIDYVMKVFDLIGS